MSKAFEKLLATQKDELLSTMKQVEEDITDELNANPEMAAYRDNIFASRVIEMLADTSVLPTPDTSSSENHFNEHAFSATVRNAKVEVWGSALIAQPDDPSTFDLHLFITDYKIRDELEEITQVECGRLFNRLMQFFEKSKEGILLRDMAPTHPAYTAANSIYQNRDKITSIRFWLLTNRIFEGAQRNGRRSVNNLECTSQIVDLKYLAEVLADEVEISQSFESIGGLPGIFIPANQEQDYSCILSAIPGSILSQLYSIHGTAIVSANVRAYLGEVKVNVGIKDTILHAPSRFLAYNNGLVISANEATFTNDRLMNISGIQIINGGQTTATIYQTWLSANNAKNSERAALIRQNLKKLLIPMKIVVNRSDMTEAERGRFRTKISEAANSQNAVKGSDLKANHPFQIALAKAVNNMPTPVGDYWFYEHARGLYKAELALVKGDQIKSRRFKLEHPLKKVIYKTEFALAYMAWNGEALLCAKGKETAFQTFADQLDTLFKVDDGIDKTLAKNLVCRWILFNSLEKHLKKDKIVQNPRVPLLYSLRVISAVYKDTIHWDRIWNRQAPSASFIDAFDKLVIHIDSLIRKNMGNFMIAMYGRQLRCQELVDNHVSLDQFGFDKVFELEATDK